MRDDASRLDVYRKILATPDDGYVRAHTRTQEAKPHKAKTWLRKSRRLKLVASLVQHDERYDKEIA